jgi:hypothetical protein
LNKPEITTCWRDFCSENNNTKIYVLKKIVTLFFFMLILFSCNKESEDNKGNEEYNSIGTITGFDATKCGCCWGWIINIENENYIIQSIADDSSLNLTLESLPVTVMLDWQVNITGCTNKITVQRIKKIS